MDRVVEGVWRPDYPKPEVEKTELRRIIAEVDPDVLAVQEIGSQALLEELQADLRLDGYDFPYAVLMEGEDTLRRVGILSKIAPKRVREHRDLDFKYFEDRALVKRGMLEVTFEVWEEKELQLFVVHLKSRWEERKDDPAAVIKRTREAEACRNRIVERTFDIEPSGGYFLIAGDFNDTRDSAALRRFYQRGDLLISERVDAFDERGSQWTHFYEKPLVYSSVDGFLASPLMRTWIKERRAVIYNDLAGSDHRLVYIDVASSPFSSL